MKTVDKIAVLLVLAGAINWGLIGIFDFNLVDFLFARMYIDRIVYVLVGIAAVYLLFEYKSLKAHAKKKR